MTDPLDHWRRNLAGGKPPIHPSDPMPGYYMRRRRMEDGRLERLPAAIWWNDGVLVAEVDGREADPINIWTSVANRPVSYEDYAFRKEHGRWPDEEEPPSVGHNRPPSDDPFVELQDEIESALSLARETLEGLKKADGTFASKADADKAANLRDRIRELRGKAEEARKKEKQPHLDAGRRVDERWKPLIERPDSAVKALQKPITAFLTAAKEAAEKVQDEAVEAEPARVGGGYSGRRTGLRTYRSAIVEDQDALYQHFRDAPEVRAVLQQLADRAARANAKVPGMRIEERQEAA